MAHLTNLPGPQGKDNQPGLKGDIFVAPIEWFETIAGFKTTNNPGDSVTIDGAHAFKVNPNATVAGTKYGFLKVYSTQDTAQFKLDPVGERDSRGYKSSLEFFHPGSGKEAAEFARIIKNTSCIVLIKTPDGQVQQMGAEGLGAEIVSSYDTGKLSGGKRGNTFKAEAYQQGNQYYEGAIDLFVD